MKKKRSLSGWQSVHAHEGGAVASFATVQASSATFLGRRERTGSFAQSGHF